MNNDFLKIANTKPGKYLLGLSQKDTIVRISHNSIHILKGKCKNHVILEGRFYGDKHIGKILSPIIEQHKIANIQITPRSIEHFSGLHLSSKFPLVLLNSGNYYTNSGDGEVLYAASGSDSWSNVRGYSSGTNITQLAAINIQASIPFASPSTPYLSRLFFPIDTSSLTSLATIQSASFYYYPTNRVYSNNSNDFSMILVTMTAASTTLALSDYSTYDSLGSPTEWSSPINIASVTLNQYNNIPLNSSGLSVISKTGITHLGMRSDRDISNNSPTDTGSDHYVTLNSSRAASNQPYLSITYTLPSGGFFLAAQ